MRAKQYGVTPCRIGAHEDYEVGELQILVAARYNVFSECAFVRGDRGSHAQSGVRIDVGTADVAFHQLVGNVIVFGQQLP